MPPPTPVQPRAAASLILLRDAPELQVLVGRRGQQVPAFPGATAFPGGKLEPQDRAWPDAAEDPTLAAAYGALRETFEETGLLIGADGGGPPASADIAAARVAVETGALSFPDLLARWERRLEPARLAPFARYVTPPGAPYRFDTWFFAAAASPQEADAELVSAEFETLGWTSPLALLDDARLRLLPPTRASLVRIAACRSATEAMQLARSTGFHEPRAPDLPA